jgi:N utilization substance protein B
VRETGQAMRRHARVTALKILFTLQFENSDPEATFTHLVSHFKIKHFDAELAKNFVLGVKANEPKLNETIEKNLVNWKLDRLPVVDRVVLQIALYELLIAKELSPSIILNEWIEISKRFCGDESPKFINGILDRIIHPAKETQSPPLHEN